MNTSQILKHLSIKLLIFTLLLSGAVFFMQYLELPFIHQYIWYIIGFFFIQSLLTTFIAGKGIKKNSVNFPPFYFMSMILRLVLTIILAFVFIAIQTPDLNVFVGNFLILYLLFLIFEIYSLLTNLRPDLDKQAKNDI